MREHSVLVVDDEPIVRESIRDWLTEAGYQVATAETGEQALQLVASRDFSVLVVDLRLPGKTGIKVLEAVKAERPWIRTIVITAYPSTETVQEARQLGAVDYLLKPFAPDNLERLIDDTLSSIPPEATVTTVEVPEAVSAPIAEAIEVKQTFAIDDDELRVVFEALAETTDVIGVVEKDGRFVFDRVKRFDDLRLDYDVTVHPPSRYLFPARETLLRLRLGDEPAAQPNISAPAQVLFGVHPYDIKAIELLDEVFLATHPDPNYIARRRNTIIIGIDCLQPSPTAFSPSMGAHQTESGFDLLLTDIGSGFMARVGTQRGAALLEAYTDAREPSDSEIAVHKTRLEKTQLEYQVCLDISRERLPKLLEDHYDDEYWEERSKTCLSCGSCVMVCPTCFCFDVKDEVELDLKTGERIREWDGCMLTDFAKVAGGENFRHSKASRFRHRIFRKGKYVLERYGMVGCVGCGRCTTACLPEIASPVEAFNAIAQEAKVQAARRLIGKIVPEDKLYAPRPAKLVRVEELTASEKMFEFALEDGSALGHQPGQFVEISIPGVGEAPISVSSSPTRSDTFQLAVRNVGNVTRALHNLSGGAMVGIRGPFGNGFPIESLKWKDLLLVAGGIGLFPLRSLIQYVLDRRDEFGRVTVLFGARSPRERVFVSELASWYERDDVEFHETVDNSDATWDGNVGVITTLIPEIGISPAKTMSVVVGPPIMYRFVIGELKKKGLADEQIIMSLERRMKCGVGKCGHCQINGVYACQEGPVFSLAELRNLREAV
ncbi:4Fe-4S dicluster domain-containing protein [Candidatus Bipolaricaulota bacterium]